MLLSGSKYGRKSPVTDKYRKVMKPKAPLQIGRSKIGTLWIIVGQFLDCCNNKGKDFREFKLRYNTKDGFQS